LSRDHYSLTYKTSLGDSNWTSLPIVPGNGAWLLLKDPGSNVSRRFYRSLQLP